MCGICLCREMSRTGFDRILNNAIKNGLIYVGISAGSMYAAGNLTDGLHIIDNPIIPHWNGSETTVLPNGKDEIKLADGKAVYVEDNYMSVYDAHVGLVKFQFARMNTYERKKQK